MGVPMHEMSIAESLIRIVEAEMANHGLRTVQRITIQHGALSTMVPEALDLAFEAMTLGTALEGAVLEYEKVPLSLRCSSCETTFSPEVRSLHFAPCPSCGEEFAHAVLTGKELNIAHIEGDT
ncbi:Hydrogenase-3 nickel incorporation protein HypA [Desulfonatronum zhilinae]|nr:Hydrogenase-3 nickel incorporation protein HypA [Desulfonatronum zhilinae]